MALRLLGHIELPPNQGKGGFDHADIHLPSDRLYVAHTSNDALDVIDIARDRYIESIPELTGVAGALVSEARELVFTSNRGENTVSVFAPGAERDAFKIPVGVRPEWFGIRPRARHPDRRQCWRCLKPEFLFGIGRGYRASGADRRNRCAWLHALGHIRCRTRDVFR